MKEVPDPYLGKIDGVSFTTRNTKLKPKIEGKQTMLSEMIKSMSTQSTKDSNVTSDIETVKKVSDTIQIEDANEGDTRSPKSTTESKGLGLKPYLRIWSYATPTDHGIRICGIVAALANGAALPLMTLVFGDMVDKFNVWGAVRRAPFEVTPAADTPSEKSHRAASNLRKGICL